MIIRGSQMVLALEVPTEFTSPCRCTDRQRKRVTITDETFDRPDANATRTFECTMCDRCGGMIEEWKVVNTIVTPTSITEPAIP